ncbi:phage tail protein [Pseudomonas syringae]|uniref:phage tail-collar fiber domain-containing protein n=1 Tax=Pseudomonas syringae TaxID=317 RepID=UPI001F3530F0|nr:phage tail protein [Pseudomonas syringae]MCF5721035.1 phage tail protein [Pseudomonas syringae]
MGAIITLAGESLIAQKQGTQQVLDVARFIFANVPGLNPATPVDRAAPKPPAAHIVYTATIPPENKGYVAPNQVVYSVQVGSDVGDWDFNWIGLETAEGVLFAVSYVPLQQKRKNLPPVQVGNNISRNFLLKFDGAQALTGITIDAKTWQHDFTVRLKGIDERERSSNRDVYGRACFFGTALQLVKVGNVYQVQPGTAYVEGIRLSLDAALTVVPGALPTTAWLDVALQRELSDAVATWSVVFGSNKVDYTDSVGARHYLVPIADLPSTSVITDRRAIEPITGALVQHFASKEFVASELVKELAKLDGKQSVRVCTTANITLSGLQTVDGIVLAAGDRVLVPLQTTAAQNGIYVTAAGAWTRATDADSGLEVTPGLLVAVEQGTANADSIWLLTTDAPITLGTTALQFEKINGSTGIPAGTYRSVTVNKRGQVIAGTNPTTLAGYGITDAQPLAVLLSDLVTNKAWGLGQNTPELVYDANTAVLPGFYSAGGTAASNFADNYSPLLVMRRQSGNVIGQIQINARDNIMFHRGSADGGTTWTTWESPWHTGNLKKTTSPTDTTPGAMLRVSDHGIGGMVVHPEANLAKVILGGKFVTAINPVGAPNDWPTGRSFLDVTGGSSYSLQLLTPTAGKRVAMRTVNGEAVGNWWELWHSENLVEATQPEAEAGTDLGRWMSPLRVAQVIGKKVVQATESILGVAKIATQALVNAGDNDSTIVTPKKLQFGFSISLADNGYIVCPTWMGGLILQWGNIASVPDNNIVNITFPLAFPTAVRLTLGGFTGDAGTSGTDEVSVTTRSRNGMSLRCAGNNTALPVNWFALGH